MNVETRPNFKSQLGC